MKFSIVFIHVLFLSLVASSQVKYNVFAGPQAITAKYTITNKKQETDMKIGFQAGVGMKIPFENKLFFAPAAFYSMKGYKVTYNLFNDFPNFDAKDNNTTIHTFELAALLQYDFNTAPNHFFIKAGPSLDFQLFGHEKINLKSGGIIDRKMKFSYGDYGRYSANLLAHIGYEMSNGFLIFAQYTHGLASIGNYDNGPVINHRAYGITIGKYLNCK